MRVLSKLFGVCAGVMMMVVLTGCNGPDDASAEAVTATEQASADPERAFFENMLELCNNTYGGRTILAPEQDDTFEPARLYFIVESCEPNEIRMPFVVDGDASRTWVLTHSDDGLLFTHEHRRDDGTEYDGSGFGGWAADGGTEWFQSFPNYRQPDDTPHDEGESGV
jgi:hypothetical protein